MRPKFAALLCRRTVVCSSASPRTPLKARSSRLIQLLAVEGVAFRRSLDLHEALVVCHHNVHVNLSNRVFFVGQIESGLAGHDSRRSRQPTALESGRFPGFRSRADGRSASASETKAPVMDVVRVFRRPLE